MKDLEQTVRAIVRDVWTHALCAALHRHPASVTAHELDGMLAPHAQQMGAHEAMIVAVAKRAREATIEDVQAKLHEADTIDHEMIDEAIEYATLRREEGEG